VKETFLVAIDGPAGVGKSSLCALISQELGFTHIDTGSMYRAVTYYALLNNLDLSDPLTYTFIDNLAITLQGEKIFLNGEDITRKIRSKEVDSKVSYVAGFSEVRSRLVTLQQKFRSGLIIMDGRDIGTKVLPDADLKIFLTALPKARAKRRLKDKQLPEEEGLLAQEEEKLVKRDYADSTRKDSPLVQAFDAIEIDTTHLTLEEVKNVVSALIKERRGIL
jgi:cytidylate kinase